MKNAIRKLRRFIGRVYVHLLINRGQVVHGMPPRLPEGSGGIPAMRLGESLTAAREALEANFDALFRGFNPSCSVMVKINLNTADPYPASSDPEAVLMLVELLRRHGIGNITVADCSSNSALPTGKVFRRTGMRKALHGRARHLSLERGRWAEVNVSGYFLKSVLLSEAIYKFDKIISLANLKTHVHTGHSAGIKNAMGLVHPRMRSAMHGASLQECIAELSLAIQPDLTIVDGRAAFVSGGPSMGTLARSGCLIAGCSQLAVEEEAYRLLCQMKEKSGHVEGFPTNPAQSAQIRHYRKLREEGRLH
jgi:uncharacterized protein (DUF362 family)